MKTFLYVVISVTIAANSAHAQQPTPRPQQSVPQREATTFDLTEYGVTFQVEPRLIVMMAALDAAGFETTDNSAFRSLVRKDLAGLDPDLRARLRSFYERNKLPAPATPADQAARYLSLALALGPLPTLDAPARSEDLPGSLLAVLDFAPLVQEFYRRSGIDEKMPGLE